MYTYMSVYALPIATALARRFALTVYFLSLQSLGPQHTHTQALGRPLQTIHDKMHNIRAQKDGTGVRAKRSGNVPPTCAS